MLTKVTDNSRLSDRAAKALARTSRYVTTTEAHDKGRTGLENVEQNST